MKAKVAKQRLDILLVERQLAESVEKARAMILAGEIRVDGARADKAGERFGDSASIEVASRSQKFASRGGLKLEPALADFSIDPAGRTCLDIGASTGGFTDCLLQHGARHVYGVDVNVAQLAWKLRQDNRVTPIERNARDLQLKDVPGSVDLVVVDVSFISAVKVLAPALEIADARADFLILVKPQFELPARDVGTGGIVTDASLQEKAVAKVRDAAQKMGLEILGVRPSRITGAEGNQEYFLHARKKVR